MFLLNFIKKVFCLFSKEDLDYLVDEFKQEINVLKRELEQKKDRITELIVENEALEERLKPNPLETYWNDKRPKKDVLYVARPLFQNTSVMCLVDPRIYFQHDKSLPVFRGTFDEIAIKCLEWVNDNISYTTDKNPSEFWQFSFETLQRKAGDCEDGAILMANMLLMSGVPYWRIRLNAGNVKGGGHAYITYLAEKDNQWYILDWCYWYEESKDLGKIYKDAEKYYNIWFSWNTKYIYLNEEYERTDKKGGKKIK